MEYGFLSVIPPIVAIILALKPNKYTSLYYSEFGFLG